MPGLAALRCTLKRLGTARIRVTDWQEQLDTPPMASMGRMKQGGRMLALRVDLGVGNERGHGQMVAVPGGVFERSLEFMVHGSGLPALVGAGRKKPCCDILSTLDLGTVKGAMRGPLQGKVGNVQS
jgi:hypothetical protein